MISVVIPVYNEEANIPVLFQRLVSSMDTLNEPFELIFVNDGSRDTSLQKLQQCHADRPQNVVVIDLQGNFGQHMAILAGFEQARGGICITIDADLQNPPEEIHKLIAKINEGYDCVGSYRAERKGDAWYRHVGSRLINMIRERTTSIVMKDQGCMLRAYDTQVVQRLVSGCEHSTFIPALAYKHAKNPTEVEVEHAERHQGESKYGLIQLARLNFDLITNFSLAPLQAFTWIGMISAFSSACLVVFLLVRRFIWGPEVGGVFTLFAVLFFLVSVVIVGIGLVGEYVGRIFQNSRTFPRYVVRSITPQSTNKQGTRKRRKSDDPS